MRHAHQLPIVFVNQIGGNDDLVFDGHSFVMNAGDRSCSDWRDSRPT